MSAIDAADRLEADCQRIIEHLRKSELWKIPGEAGERAFRVSPTPFGLSPKIIAFLNRLGPALFAFYRAANTLYLRGELPSVREYLDLGKPESLIEHGRMNYQKSRLPAVIRPDILLTTEGPLITELDSVPGGIGLTAGMAAEYGLLGYEPIGGRDGMEEGFWQAITALSQDPEPTLAIVVSEESDSYRPEMQWLAASLRNAGHRAFTIRPEELTFTEGGLFLECENRPLRIDIVYRFFELFDLKNIPKSELISYAARKRMVIVTPPYKHYLEEKMLLALLHHPMLEKYWQRELGDADLDLLRSAVPPTWILDPRPAPPHTVIPGFVYREAPINDWRVIRQGTQKERRLVIKPSGFSPLAWGSRGVVVGHDVSADAWASAVQKALDGFNVTPYVLQHFYEGKRVEVEYFDEQQQAIRTMQGRVRLSPYYFIVGDGVRLCGALATICPLDKKLIHGMVDAVMVPCAPAMEAAGNA